MTKEMFLQAVINQPDNDTVRLAYADWLEDQGDSDRAYFIRLQIELSTLKEGQLYRREKLEAETRTLLKKHRNKWQQPFQELAISVEFRRGFIEKVKMETTQFIQQTDLIFTLAPINHLEFGPWWNDASSFLKRLHNCAYIDRIAHISLDFGCYQANDALLKLLAESATLICRLKTLRIMECNISTHGLHSMLHASALRSLEHLSLTECNRSGESLSRVVSYCRNLNQLKYLSLANNELNDVDAVALSRLQTFNALEYLFLPNNSIGDMGMEALAQSASFSKLFCLDVSNNLISDTGVLALLATPNLKRLSGLYVYGNPISRNTFRLLKDFYGENFCFY